MKKKKLLLGIAVFLSYACSVRINMAEHPLIWLVLAFIFAMSTYSFIKTL